MFFNIAVDIFQQMIRVANSLLQSPMSNKIAESIITLQYADDTAIIAEANITSLISFKLTLRLFTKASRLQVNFSKNTFIPLNIAPVELAWVKSFMGCSQTTFPITYLSMPFTIRKPTKKLYMPLVEKIKRRLEVWQSKLLSRGGRLELV